MLSQELERHAQHRPELTEVLDVICKRVSPFTALHMSRTTLNAEGLQAVFDVLHGKPVEAIRNVLTEFVERHTRIMDNGERIPTYKPMVFKVESVQRPAKVLATVRSPVSFAAELDAVDVQDIIPLLLPGHTPAYEIEPLPWE